MYPTRTVVFGSTGSDVTGSGQLQGLGAATAEVAKVARAVARRVKNCMMLRTGLTMLGGAKWLG